ncbi:MAG: phospholipase D-like domain-containing protein, partial [Acidobacteriota bacterium]|nr:phospholipase D-like domain-containing protein [Acidobacteriota bacterium]
MPRIFDNIDLPLLPALKETLQVSERADFSVGYFNLRGWKLIDKLIDEWAGGEGACCRLLVGMQSAPEEEFRAAYSLSDSEEIIDQGTVVRLRRKVAEQFKEQLEFGAPTNSDDAGLRRLSAQLKAKKVIVKLFLRHRLHAKLYLLHRRDPNNPTVGFVGSSNLTMSGLAKQGELNVDVLDHDACQKLQKWFEDRWADSRCIDISEELADIIDNSWVRERLPYHIYLKIAYHLSQEARAGLSEFRIPRDFGNRLFEFQTAAVKIAAHHLNKRGGVLIGDVVGLGKTLMATALARIFEDDQGVSTLIICPKNLAKMWQAYVDRYGMRAKVMSASKVIKDLPNVPARYRLVLIDESHNMRNREGKRYRAIQEYIKLSDSRCILL